MSSEESLPLRGHHFLCILHYQGAGYSGAFTANFDRVVKGVAEGRVRKLKVARHGPPDRDPGQAPDGLPAAVAPSPEGDPICSACPSRQADGRCKTEASVGARDRALLEGMGWEPGQELPLDEAMWSVLERREELMAQVCPGCEWLPRCQARGPYGIASPLGRPGHPPA